MTMAIQTMGDNDEELAATLAGVALRAGATVCAIVADGLVAERKPDGSPVTNADAQAEALILSELRALAPDVPVIAEESFAAGALNPSPPEFFLVDPLDGTRDLLAGHNDYTVNIALIRAGAPVAGAVFAPAQGRLWFASGSAWAVDAPVGGGLPARGRWRAIHARRSHAEALVALVSRSHPDQPSLALLAALGVRERATIGSSLKFCLLAQGDGDLYPRFSPTMEWDTAAGDAVLRAAGGVVLDETGATKRYGNAANGYRNGGFVALADPALSDRVAQAMARDPRLRPGDT
jgi:3'(2'), 5'-bisphosphate nucleotidase